MYKFKYFTEEDNEKILAFISENTFAFLSAIGDEYPVATQVPLDIKIENDKLFLTGHIMKNTDHHKALVKNNNVLAVFTGPHCYVSASWYINPNVASTWNYMSVQAKGKIIFGDEMQTKKIVEDLTNKYEMAGSEAAFDKLPVEYVNKLVKAIVGFTIEVEDLQNVFKLSQNHDEETRRNIIKQLHKNGSNDEKRIANEMEARLQLSQQY